MSPDSQWDSTGLDGHFIFEHDDKETCSFRGKREEEKGHESQPEIGQSSK